MGRKSPPRELLPATACIPCSSLCTDQHTWNPVVGAHSKQDSGTSGASPTANRPEQVSQRWNNEQTEQRDGARGGHG